MSEAKFTKGPWFAGKNVRGETSLSSVVDGSRKHYVARLSWDQKSTEEMTATARLIAAAPDLYAALTAVIGIGYVECREPASQDYVSKDAIAKVRAALAKARGE